MLEYDAKDIEIAAIAEQCCELCKKTASSFIAVRKGTNEGEKKPAACTTAGNKK